MPLAAAGIWLPAGLLQRVFCAFAAGLLLADCHALLLAGASGHLTPHSSCPCSWYWAEQSCPVLLQEEAISRRVCCCSLHRPLRPCAASHGGVPVRRGTTDRRQGAASGEPMVGLAERPHTGGQPVAQVKPLLPAKLKKRERATL